MSEISSETASFTASKDGNLTPLKFFLSLLYNQKSEGTRSGEYAGCGRRVQPSC